MISEVSEKTTIFPALIYRLPLSQNTREGGGKDSGKITDFTDHADQPRPPDFHPEAACRTRRRSGQGIAGSAENVEAPLQIDGNFGARGKRAASKTSARPLMLERPPTDAARRAAFWFGRNADDLLV